MGFLRLVFMVLAHSFDFIFSFNIVSISAYWRYSRKEKVKYPSRNCFIGGVSAGSFRFGFGSYQRTILEVLYPFLCLLSTLQPLLKHGESI